MNVRAAQQILYLTSACIERVRLQCPYSPEDQDAAYLGIWRAIVSHRVGLGLLRGTEKGQLRVVDCIRELLD